jgi:hypothetical protein
MADSTFLLAINSIAIGVTTFALGVLAVRNFGGILVPGF